MRQIGPYQLLELLGKGGMGEVYLAEDVRLGRKIALKLLPPELTNDENRVLRFQQEARTASALNHPNILTIFDIGEVESTHFIATEFVKGETLRDATSATRMNVQKALNVTIQVANALGAAHEVGVVHRDIKPENIMVRRDGLVKVLDFGIAKLTQRTVTGGKSEMGLLPLVTTEPNMVMGTPKYMSPEQLRALDVDERADIFSLGVVLYEIITGTAPFERETVSDTIVAILQTEPPPIAQSAAEVPDGLQEIIAKALCKDRDERYQTMGDLMGDLRSLERQLETAQPAGLPIWSGNAPTVMAAADQMTSEPQKHRPLQSREIRAARTTSSVEYIVSEIKQHKRSAALIVALLVAATAAALYFSRPAPSSKTAINSVAVLPFVNTSDDPNMEYLSDGISETLINRLAQLPQIKVIARSSSFKYRGKEIDHQEVARSLGVQAIVTGWVVQHADQLQVSVELVDARDQTHMWGEQYNRKATDLQAMQEEIARIISEKLRLQLTGAQAQQLLKHPTENAQAYQLYLNGIYDGRKSGTQAQNKALDDFNQAIALDPNFALAHANISLLYTILADFGALDPKEATPKARAAAQKALDLDEMLAEAHAAMALVKYAEWDWQGAENEHRKALELSPNFAAAHSNYAPYLSTMGRHAEALAEIKRAQELDPLRISFRKTEADILQNARRYEEAIEQYQNVIKLQPDYVEAHAYLGYAYAAKGLYAEAIAEYQKFMSLEGELTTLQVFMGYAYARSGKRDKALALLNALIRGKDYVSPAELAILYAGLGNTEEAFAALERAYAAHDPQLKYLKVESHYDALRSDPRFTALAQKVGLAP